MLNPLDFFSTQSVAYYVGAVLIMLFQVDKFNKINLGIPEFSKYREFLSGVGARDVSSVISYLIALVAFYLVSLMIYTLACQLSPTVVSGFLELFHSSLDVNSEKIPYPLYIAAIFVGLAQPTIPGLESFSQAQRDLFHSGISVLRRIIQEVELIVAELQAKGKGKAGLITGVVQLLDRNLEVESREFFDAGLFNSRVEPLELPQYEDGALKTYLESLPDRALLYLAKNIVLSALISATRKSGLGGVQRLFQKLNISWTYTPVNFSAAVIATIMFFVLTIIVILLLGVLRAPFQMILRVPPGTGAWGRNFVRRVRNCARFRINCMASWSSRDQSISKARQCVFNAKRTKRGYQPVWWPNCGQLSTRVYLGYGVQSARTSELCRKRDQR